MANATGGTCPNCGRTIAAQQGKGRRRRYCDATCRSAARRARTTGVRSGLTSASRGRIVDVVSVGPLPAVAVARADLQRGEQALRAAVERARDQGHTWQEIGEVLGTTRQAAFQRFGRSAVTDAPVQLADVIDRAAELLAGILQGKQDAVRLTSAWARLTGTVGTYRSMGTPCAYQAGEYTIVDTRVTFAAGDLTGRVTFAADGTVAGLRFVPVST